MIAETFNERLEAFRAMVEQHQAERHKRLGYTHIKPPKVTVKPGRKYIKVDVGTSGKYMVEPTGDGDGHIWGIKAYGVIHRGHYYGELSTIEEWFWGDYNAVKRKG